MAEDLTPSDPVGLNERFESSGVQLSAEGEGKREKASEGIRALSLLKDEQHIWDYAPAEFNAADINNAIEVLERMRDAALKKGLGATGYRKVTAKDFRGLSEKK